MPEKGERVHEQSPFLIGCWEVAFLGIAMRSPCPWPAGLWQLWHPQGDIKMVVLGQDVTL